MEYACNDAYSVARILTERFTFPDDCVSVLQDEDATKENILSEFLRFTQDDINPDERIIVFFAGHGHTRTGRRGEIGFLVPCDGDVENINTLIRWDELTRNTELIVAKHVLLLIMDACYGGTAVQRYLPPGSMRFARDMLRRCARQVLTAGKADEVVADAGGPRAGHSVFTGHLLDGLEGAAASAGGLITANGLMAYVYDKVAKDYQSHQTPHYGFLDGDGDMIFNMSPLEDFEDSPKAEEDIPVHIPASSEPQVNGALPPIFADRIKEYLSDSRHRIKLHDNVASEIQSALTKTSIEHFPVRGMQVSNENFIERLSQYETAISRLIIIVIILARWGDHSHRKTLKTIFSRLRDNQSELNGLVPYLGLQWYPISFLAYVGGISALVAGDYKNLATIFLTPIPNNSHNARKPIIVPMVEGILDVEHSNLFKSLPGHDRYYTPRSEYMYNAVQPHVDDALFLGTDYEHQFDRFEILLALVYADLTWENGGRIWGPIGRFGWKTFGVRSRYNSFEEVVQEAALLKGDWELLKSGLFSGSYARFEEVSNGYRELLRGLRWF